MHRITGLAARTALPRSRSGAVSLALALAAATSALAAPAAARSAHGGGSVGLGATGDTGATGVTGGSGGSGGSGTTAPQATTVPSATTAPPGTSQSEVLQLTGLRTASADGVTLTLAATGTQGHPLLVSGEAPVTDAGARALIQMSRTGGRSWTQVASAVISSSGAFTTSWTPTVSAEVELRVALADPLTSAPLSLPVFRDAGATIFGPGLWGHHTACGGRLLRTTLGVASRTLKCGAQVAVYYRGREITVPVIDRGPFGSRATWDLTRATAQALGMAVNSTVGTIAPAPALATTPQA